MIFRTSRMKAGGTGARVALGSRRFYSTQMGMSAKKQWHPPEVDRYRMQSFRVWDGKSLQEGLMAERAVSAIQRAEHVLLASTKICVVDTNHSFIHQFWKTHFFNEMQAWQSCVPLVEFNGRLDAILFLIKTSTIPRLQKVAREFNVANLETQLLLIELLGIRRAWAHRAHNPALFVALAESRKAFQKHREKRAQDIVSHSRVKAQLMNVHGDKSMEMIPLQFNQFSGHSTQPNTEKVPVAIEGLYSGIARSTGALRILRTAIISSISLYRIPSLTNLQYEEFRFYTERMRLVADDIRHLSEEWAALRYFRLKYRPPSKRETEVGQGIWDYYHANSPGARDRRAKQKAKERKKEARRKARKAKRDREAEDYVYRGPRVNMHNAEEENEQPL